MEISDLYAKQIPPPANGFPGSENVWRNTQPNQLQMIHRIGQIDRDMSDVANLAYGETPVNALVWRTATYLLHE
jgi:hypothetical protein